MEAEKFTLLLWSFRCSDGNREENREGQKLYALGHFCGGKTVLGVSYFQVPQVSAPSPLRGSLPECRKNKIKTENKTP